MISNVILETSVFVCISHNIALKLNSFLNSLLIIYNKVKVNIIMTLYF